MDLPVAPTSNVEPQKMGSENDELSPIATVIWWVPWQFPFLLPSHALVRFSSECPPVGASKLHQDAPLNLGIQTSRKCMKMWENV